jgi:hypothetical protein
MKRSSGPRKTANFSRSIHQQLNMYALAAGAAGVGVLALAQPAEAKIVYTAGTTHSLNLLPALTLAQTFEMVFFQFHGHPEYKSLASAGTSCKADTAGLLKRYPVAATSFQPIGKETEHGWEQPEDISTLMPSLVRYREKIAIAGSEFQARLQQSSLAVLQGKTGLSRHTILRARRGQKVRANSLKLLRTATRMAQ